MKTITITITGNAGYGKTILAKKINSFLQDAGIETTIQTEKSDPDISPLLFDEITVYNMYERF